MKNHPSYSDWETRFAGLRHDYGADKAMFGVV